MKIRLWPVILAMFWIGASGAAHALTDVLPETTDAAAPRSGSGEGYRKECGGWRMACPSQFLPERSWRKVVHGLADDFGEDAELPSEDARAVESRPVGNAADHAGSRLRTIARWVRDDKTPLRVSLLPYFVAKLKQVPERLVLGNPAVSSISRFSECHRKAETNDSCDDREIVISGFGRWEEDDEE